jgi:preprotein translocase subunit YajC
MAFNTYSICKNFPLIKQVKNILIYIWIPLVGIIANFLTFRQLFKEDKQRQKLHKGMNKNKEQLPVIVLLVEVTFVVVLAV